MKSVLFFAVFVLAPLAALPAADTPPFRDPSLPLEQRVQDLLGAADAGGEGAGAQSPRADGAWTASRCAPTSGTSASTA